MPKNKTHSGTSKRVRVNGAGALHRQQTHLRHNLEKKPTSRTRRLSGLLPLSAADARRVRKLLGR
jgi:large subunit ribosomal protein L35